LRDCPAIRSAYCQIAMNGSLAVIASPGCSFLGGLGYLPLDFARESLYAPGNK